MSKILVPLDNLKASAEFFLDSQLEAQITWCLDALFRASVGNMPSEYDDWAGYEPCLWVYAYTLMREWKARGLGSLDLGIGGPVYAETVLMDLKPARELIKPHTLVYPPWLVVIAEKI